MREVNYRIISFVLTGLTFACILAVVLKFKAAGAILMMVTFPGYMICAPLVIFRPPDSLKDQITRVHKIAVLVFLLFAVPIYFDVVKTIVSDWSDFVAEP